MCPPMVRICLLVPPFKLSSTVTFLTIPRRWNTCSDGSAIPEHGDQRSKKHSAWYCSGIKSKYKFEYKYGLRSDLKAPNFKTFSGGACPQTPLVHAYLHHHRCHPNRKYLPPPMYCMCMPKKCSTFKVFVRVYCHILPPTIPFLEGIPYDGVPREDAVSVHLSLTIIFAILATVGIAFAVACLVFNFIFRTKK